MRKSKHEERLKNFPVGDSNVFIETKCILTTCNCRICTFLMYNCGWKFSLIGFILILLRYVITVWLLYIYICVYIYIYIYTYIYIYINKMGSKGWYLLRFVVPFQYYISLPNCLLRISYDLGLVISNCAAKVSNLAILRIPGYEAGVEGFW